MTSRPIYIYALQDPRTEQIRYIGKTGNLKSRLYFHLQCKDVNRHKVGWIQQLKTEGLKPAMLTLEETTEVDWPEREKYWIAHGRQEGWPLTNISEGGKQGQSITLNIDDALLGYIDAGLVNAYLGLSETEKLAIAMGAFRAAESHYKQVFAYWFRSSDNPADVQGSIMGYRKSREYINSHLMQMA